MTKDRTHLASTMLTAALSLSSFSALADQQPPPPTAMPQPLIATEDLRTDAPDTRYFLEPWGSFGHIGGPAPGGTVDLYSWQMGLGPGTDSDQPVPWPIDYSLRIRGAVIETTAGASVGPLTFGLQRLFSFDPLSVAPLLDVHAGIEVAVATPWLSGRTISPPSALQVMNAVDTELAGNGWSLRPAEVYLRADLLACRNLYLEAGVSPQVFLPTEPGRTNEVDLGWRADFGLSFACKHRSDSFLHHLAAVLGVRGLGRLYAADEPPAHHATASVALQYDKGLVTLGGFLIVDTVDPTSDWSSVERTLGVRLQIGFGARADN
jgi:hypothetical protein